MLTVLAAVAQLALSVMRERQAEGIAIAQAAGKYDRGSKLTTDQITQVRQRVADGVPKANVARNLDVAHDALRGAEGHWAVLARRDSRDG